MKKILAVLAVSAFVLGISLSAIGQKPPQPPGKGQSGDQPVPGGSAPIDGGLSMLLLLGAGYGAKRVFDARKRLAE